jgi:hypothetical protein
MWRIIGIHVGLISSDQTMKEVRLFLQALKVRFEDSQSLVLLMLGEEVWDPFSFLPLLNSLSL